MQSFNRYLTPPEEKRLFSTIKSFAGPLAERDHAWMKIARNTGLRVGTLAGLTVGDARQSLRTGYLQIRPEISKRKQAHTVHLNKVAVKALRALLKIRREMGHAEMDDAPLIVSRNHRGLSVRSFQARMNKWVQAAGLDVHATPHWFRHTLAIRVMRSSTQDDPRGRVQGILGHRDINSTAVYTRPTREELAETLDEVAA